MLIPGSRVRYLAEIAEQGRSINSGIEHQAEFASKAQHYYEALKELGDDKLPRAARPLRQRRSARRLSLRERDRG